ncbi:MAG: type II toxin-antitoxin system prevent-host-death family antitoxin [Pseudomonadota bacterium]
MNIPVSEAKAKFSEIIRRVEAGEEIVLTRNGKPVARMSEPQAPGPHPGELRKAARGKYAGQFSWPEDFDDDDDIEWDGPLIPPEEDQIT